MSLSQLDVLGILLGTLGTVAGIMYFLSAAEITRKYSESPAGPMDGYSLVVSICTALFAFFGPWLIYKVGETFGVQVNLGVVAPSMKLRSNSLVKNAPFGRWTAQKRAAFYLGR